MNQFANLLLWLVTTVFSLCTILSAQAEQATIVLEAEKAQLLNGASKMSNNSASGGFYVGNLGGGTNGGVTFTNVSVNQAGSYNLTLRYASLDERSFFLSINGGASRSQVLAITGGWSAFKERVMTVQLIAGNNTIKIDNSAGWAPNLDKITITPSSAPVQAPTVLEAENAQLFSGASKLTNNSASGGFYVGNLGGSSNGAVSFTNVWATQDGTYNLKFTYASLDPRSFYISVNDGGSTSQLFPATGGWSTFSEIVMPVQLIAGNNTIKIDNGAGWAPNLDKITLTPASQSIQAGMVLEAENAQLSNSASKIFNNSASGGFYVSNLGGTSNGALTFNNVWANQDGTYNLTFSYASLDPRSFYLSVNDGGSTSQVFPATGGWNTFKESVMAVHLRAGNNTIKIDNGFGWAPNLDKITLTTLPAAGPDVIQLIRGDVKVEYDLSTGYASFYYRGARKIHNFYAGVRLETLGYKTSRDYSSRISSTLGNTTTITLNGNGLPQMQQVFTLNGGNHFLTSVSVTGSNLSTNWAAPIVVDNAGGVDIGSYNDNRFLKVPFDNDKWVRYNAVPVNDTGTSFEVSAIYNNANRNGLVVGSVTHDTWKTGIWFKGSFNKLDKLNVFGGVTDENITHDRVEHGSVTGDTVSAPLVFVGFSPDWRNLLEEFADVNAAMEPKLNWSGGVPFGWNSWGKIQTQINYSKAITTADFIKNNLMENSFQNDGTVYINLDSYWDRLSRSELKAFVEHCLAQGQKAGIYWAPFTDWGRQSARKVEGSTFTYGEIWLRDTAGNPIELDGAYAIDPTHPATQIRMDHFLRLFNDAGFHYIKLDFLTHGTLESTVRYDHSIKTGIQAYNLGMQAMREKINGSMFVSLSIAPLFPHQYGHARRIATDTFGSGNDTEYLLNALTYGWWTHGKLYAFNDPDHMVFEGFSANENKSRVISGAIAGTVFLSGDDFTTTTGQNLAKINLTKSEINTVAKLGKTFRPLEGNTGSNATNAFILKHDSDHYIAVFNYSKNSTTLRVDLTRAGLSGTAVYLARDLWNGATSEATGRLNVSLGAQEAKLFKLILIQ